MAQESRQELRARARQGATSSSTKSRSSRSSVAGGSARPFNLPFENMNVYIILAGLGVIVLGYILMGSGDALGFVPLNISPFVLVIGYLIVIPVGIMYGTRKKKAAEAMQQSQENSAS